MGVRQRLFEKSAPLDADRSARELTEVAHRFPHDNCLAIMETDRRERDLPPLLAGRCPCQAMEDNIDAIVGTELIDRSDRVEPRAARRSEYVRSDRAAEVGIKSRRTAPT